MHKRSKMSALEKNPTLRTILIGRAFSVLAALVISGAYCLFYRTLADVPRYYAYIDAAMSVLFFAHAVKNNIKGAISHAVISAIWVTGAWLILSRVY